MASDGLMDYFAKIGLDASEFLNGISKSQAGVLAFYRDVSVSLNMTIQIFDRLASVVSAYGANAQQLRDMSIVTGMSADELQRLQYNAVISGTSFSNVQMSISKLTLSMDEARDSTSAASKAFKDIGVDVSGKTSYQVFDETTRALMAMEDETKRNAAANDIYGRSWKELIPYMDSFIENQDEIRAHPTISQEELNNLEDAKVAWDTLNNSLFIYSGKALAAVETQFTQKTLADIGYMAVAYKKLFSYDVKGFMDDAAAYHDKKAKEEAAKITANAAKMVNKPGEMDIGPGIFGTLKDSVDVVSDAMKDYASAIDDVADAQERLNDINKNYTRDLQSLNPRDVQGFINLRMRHQWDLEDQTAAVSSKTAAVGQAAGNVGLAGMAAAGIVINGPITVNGDKSFEKEIQNQRIRAGVR